MQERKFWMVYLEGQRPPQYKHGSYDSALREAKRLAQTYEKKAYILETTKTVELSKFVIEDTIAFDDNPDLPF